jgi:predicted Zn-dependent protease
MNNKKKKMKTYYKVLNKNHLFLKITYLIEIILKKILLNNIKKIEA